MKNENEKYQKTYEGLATEILEILDQNNSDILCSNIEFERFLERQITKHKACDVDFILYAGYEAGLIDGCLV